MSERYGSPGELQEIFEYFEQWVREEIDKVRTELKSYYGPHPRYLAGRLDSLRDVLSYLDVDK